MEEMVRDMLDRQRIHVAFAENIDSGAALDAACTALEDVGIAATNEFIVYVAKKNIGLTFGVSATGAWGEIPT